MYALYTNALTIRGGYYSGNQFKGAWITQSPAAHVIGAVFGTNQRGNDQFVPSQLFLEGAFGSIVTGCHFEDWAINGANNALVLNCEGAHIDGNAFIYNTSNANAVGIYIGFTSHGIVVGPNSYKDVGKLVEVADNDSVRSVRDLSPGDAVSLARPNSRVSWSPRRKDRGHVVFTPTMTGSWRNRGHQKVPRLSEGKRIAWRHRIPVARNVKPW